jgi:metacaspase-1
LVLTKVFQSCHSGSALDLPYVYSTEGKIKEPNLKLEAGKDAIGIAKAYFAKDMHGVFEGAGSLFQKVAGQNSKAQQKAKKTRTSPADVVSLLTKL